MKPLTPRLILAVDNSQIKQFKSCPRSWYYRYVLNLTHKGPQKKALDMGTLIHGLCDFYYRRQCLGDKPVEAYKYSIFTFEKQYKSGKIVTDLTTDEIKFVATRFFEYHCNYTMQGDFTPLTIHGHPQVEVGFSIPLISNTNFQFVLEGKIDLILNDFTFVDHKTQGREYEHYTFDTQWLTYGLATSCTKVIVNYIGTQQKILPHTFRRSVHTFTQEKLLSYKQYIIETMYKMANCLQTGHFPTEWTSCAGSWGTVCEYHKIDEPVEVEERRNNLLAYYTTDRPRWSPWEEETFVLTEEK